MSNLLDWAKEELERISEKDDKMQQEINKDILEIVEVFSKQGHSGFSASYALNILKRLLDWKPITPLTGEELNILKRLLDWKPITPLTGEDSEWKDVSEWSDGKNLQQNRRCSAVFRENNDNSTAYYLNGKVFSKDGGKTWYICRESSIPVKFPFTVPEKPEYIILKEENNENN